MKCWKESPECEQHCEKVPCDLIHYASGFQIAQRYYRLVIRTAVPRCEASGHQFSRRGRRITAGYRLCSEGNRVHWVCMVLEVQELISLSTSLFFPAGWATTTTTLDWTAFPDSFKDWYDSDSLQGLSDFSPSNQSPTPAHIVYVRTHTEPMLLVSLQSSCGPMWFTPWAIAESLNSLNKELALVNTTWLL